LKGDKHYLRTVCNIRPEWLMEMAPKYYEHVRAVCPEVNQRISSVLAKIDNAAAIAELVDFFGVGNLRI
jgi:hypothetical protein